MRLKNRRMLLRGTYNVGADVNSITADGAGIGAEDVQLNQLEHEAEAARQRIARNVDQLHQRIRPRNLMHEAMDSVANRGTNMMRRMQNYIWENRALTVAGVATIVSLVRAKRNRTARQAQGPHLLPVDYAESEWLDSPDQRDDHFEGMRAATGQLRDRLGTPTAAVAALAGTGLGMAKEKSMEAAARARMAAHNAKRWAEDEIETSPLAVIATGLAAGAVLALLIPKTRYEEDKLGHMGDAVRDAVDDAVAATRTATQDALHGIGLSLENMKSHGGDIAFTIAKVAVESLITGIFAAGAGAGSLATAASLKKPHESASSSDEGTTTGPESVQNKAKP